MAVVRYGRQTGLANVHLGRSTVGYLADRSVRRFVSAFIGSPHDAALRSGGKLSLGAIEMAFGQYEPMTSLVLQRCLKPGMVMVDVGAHIGHYTLLSANAVGEGGRVYSFEPHPGNFGDLSTNVAAGGFKNVSAFPYAVADVEGEVLIYADPLDSGLHSMYARTPEAQKVSVKGVVLASFLEGLGVRYVDMVKMDIEGAEPLAVEGLRPLIETGRVGVLVVEFSPLNLRRAGWEPLEFLRRLKTLGLEVYAIDDAVRTIAPLSVRFQEDLGHRQVNLLCSGPRGMLKDDWAGIGVGTSQLRSGRTSMRVAR